MPNRGGLFLRCHKVSKYLVPSALIPPGGPDSPQCLKYHPVQVQPVVRIRQQISRRRRCGCGRYSGTPLGQRRRWTRSKASSLNTEHLNECVLCLRSWSLVRWLHLKLQWQVGTAGAKVTTSQLSEKCSAPRSSGRMMESRGVRVRWMPASN